MDLEDVKQHWRAVAWVIGLGSALRALWWLAISVAVAPWERDQMKRQVVILERRIAYLDRLVRDGESGNASAAGSSDMPDSIPTTIRRRRRSSAGSTRSSRSFWGTSASPGTQPHSSTMFLSTVPPSIAGERGRREES